MYICREGCVLSGCDGLITHSEESYGVWSVWSVIVKPQQ